MKTKLFSTTLICTFTLCLVLFQSCKKEETVDPTPPVESLETPRISSLTELLDEPKRGLAVIISFDGNADGFEIQKKEGGTFTTIGNLGPSNSQNHNDTYENWDLGINKYYTYRVRAFKGEIKSEWSSEKGKTSSPIQTSIMLSCDAIADAYVDQALPNQNFGNDDVLEVFYDGSDHYRTSYIKFDLTKIPSYAVGIDFAQLKIFSWGEPTIDPATPNGFQLLSPWDEYNVTWNNKPTESVGGIFIIQTIYNNAQYYYFDIKGTVDNWVIDGDQNYGISIRCYNSIGRSIILSREEYYEYLRPHLEVRYEW